MTIMNMPMAIRMAGPAHGYHAGVIQRDNEKNFLEYFTNYGFLTSAFVY